MIDNMIDRFFNSWIKTNILARSVLILLAASCLFGILWMGGYIIATCGSAIFGMVGVDVPIKTFF